MTLYSIQLSFPKRPDEKRRAQIEAVLEPLGSALSSFERGKGWRFEVLAEHKPDQKKLLAVLAPITRAKPKISKLPKKNWVKESEKNLPPISTGRFFIHGSHFTGNIPKNKKPFLIDASIAFGTGRHETTKLCLLALTDLYRSKAKPVKIFDLGTGTGILAFAAAHLFGVKTLAADNDRDSVRIATENAKLNHCAEQTRIFYSDGYQAAMIRRSSPFHLIIANILANPLIELAADLKSYLAPGGHAILSGLMIDQEKSVLAAHRALRLVRTFRKGKWSALLLQSKKG